IPPVPYLVPFPGGMQIYGELGSEDKWSKIPIPSRAAFLAGLYVPQVFSGDTLDLRIEYADTDYTRRKTGDHLERVWYNNGTYQSGMRFKGQPLGHWMGTDAIDLFVRSSRFLTDELQLGAHAEWLERDRGQPVHETKREAGVDLTWWISPNAQFTLAYVYQRIKNPGTITSINPFVEQFANGVTSNNHLFWTTFAVSF
ncbi:MAG: capsule assembly Wzi family protein, partial [Nitrospirales bacterium]